MQRIVNKLNLSQTHREKGMRVYRLALMQNMTQGRRVEEVAAACLYVGCRQDKECQVMLIDISDVIGVRLLLPFFWVGSMLTACFKVNVFTLGQIYNAIIAKTHLYLISPVWEANPEYLIQRFVRDLEFGDDEHRIAKEAIQILQRMKRDWILVGRRPAGVCGAAVILAARMNNYRRTVREVVYTAKVADVTINKRLDEFQVTESSKLSVDEFRHHGLELEKEHDPPAYYRKFEKKKKKKGSKRKRQEEEEPDTAAEFVSVSSASPRSTVEPEDSQMIQLSAQAEADRQAMPPPSIPIDPQLFQNLASNSQEVQSSASALSRDNSVEPPPAKRMKAGRPPGAKNKPLPQKLGKAIEDEERIEADMNEILNDPKAVEDAAAFHDALTRQASQEASQPPSQQTGQQPSQQPSLQPSLQPSQQTDQQASQQLDQPADQQTGQAVQQEGQRAGQQAGSQAGQKTGEQAGRQAIEQPSQQASPPLTQDTAVAPSGEKSTPTTENPVSKVPPVVEIDLSYLDEDPEVRDCMLSAEEQALKERVWVTENGDWLKKKQAQQINKELAIRNGTAPQPKRRNRRRARMGDMSQYHGTREDGSVGSFDNATDAAAAMMKNRSFSKKINYDMITYLFNKEDKGSSKSVASDSRASSSTRRASRTSEPPPLLMTADPVASKTTRRKAAPKQPRAVQRKAPATPKKPAAKAKSPQASSSSAAVSKKPAEQPKAPKAKATPDILSSVVEASKKAKEADVYASERHELESLAQEGKSTYNDDGSDDDESHESEEDEVDEEAHAKDYIARMYGNGGDNDDDDFSDYGDEVD